MTQSLRSAIVVAPLSTALESSSVWRRCHCVQDHLGDETVYHIVGKDETDPDRNFISWYSPLAKALLKTRVGDHIRFRSPNG